MHSLVCVDDHHICPFPLLQGAIVLRETEGSRCIDGGSCQRLRHTHVQVDTGEVHHHWLHHNIGGGGGGGGGDGRNKGDVFIWVNNSYNHVHYYYAVHV